jgi:site-specific DNA recombinase
MVRKEEAYMDRIVKRIDPSLPAQPKLVRAAGYARVSSGKDAMLHSLSAQISYYSELIQKHPGWSYCGVYADEAMTGTKDNRESFQRLITDCRAGKIDMVITKSISRFARNTLTLLSTVRELKELGVDVFFEEQNIHTLSADGELMLTILASYAQEESRSASENKKWQIRRSYEKARMCSGIFSTVTPSQRMMSRSTRSKLK